MESVTVTTKGQIVIPARIRKKYKIEEGTRVCFIESGSDIVVRPVTDEYIDRVRGSLGTKGRALKRLLQEKQREREL